MCISLDSLNDRGDEPSSVSVPAPTEDGFYVYSDGNQNMIFLLNDGQWHVLFSNTTFEKCDWGYIEQALGVWGLMKLTDQQHNRWLPNGDVIIQRRTTFRQIGWRVNGGPNNGLIVTEITEQPRHGGYSPVYIEVGD